MPPLELETRVAILEAELERLRARIEPGGTPPTPWWERIAGTFADDSVQEEAMRLGRAYRESLRLGKPRARKR